MQEPFASYCVLGSALLLLFSQFQIQHLNIFCIFFSLCQYVTTPIPPLKMNYKNYNDTVLEMSHLQNVHSPPRATGWELLL